MKLAGSIFKERKSLGEDVFDYLRDAIIDQTIEPGSILVESKVAQMLNVSRTPLREALHKLEKEEWIEKTPSGSFQVICLTDEDIEQTIGIRSVLEAYAARLASENHAKKDLDPLENMLGKYQTCLENKDYNTCHTILTEFHDYLYELSRNQRLIKMIQQLRAKISIFRQILIRENSFARECWMDHVEMMFAIKSRNGDRVEKVVREHILKGGTAVLKIFREKKGEEQRA